MVVREKETMNKGGGISQSLSSFVEETEEDIVQRLRATEGGRRYADPHFPGNNASIYGTKVCFPHSHWVIHE